MSTDLKKNIIAARTAKKLTQAQLGQLINEKPQIIQEYERCARRAVRVVV